MERRGAVREDLDGQEKSNQHLEINENIKKISNGNIYLQELILS